MLIGSYVQRIDLKGRVALPSRFKKELGLEVILSRWYERSLAVFSKKAWEEMISVVTTSVITSPARDTERFLLGGAFEIVLDAQGRFVIPPTLRDHASLKEVKEVVFVGLNKRIEVWSRKNWEEREKRIVERAEELIEEATTFDRNRRSLPADVHKISITRKEKE